MEKKSIFFAYRHTEKPWGGANSFIRALYGELEKNPEYFVHHDIEKNSRIIFFSQLSSGPGNVELGKARKYALAEIRELKKRSGAKLVVRAVNLNINILQPGFKSIAAYLKDGVFPDIESVRLMNMADFVIFQSDFQRSFFFKWGYRGRNNTVIHNGAPAAFQNDDFEIGRVHNPLRLVSNSNYKPFKRHEIVAKISLLDGVEVTHLGKWSLKTKNHKVMTKGTLTHEEIVKIYKESDYLLHPAVNDPCPNAVIEALYFGLPVIYSERQGSSKELVGENGIAIDEKDLQGTMEKAKMSFGKIKQKLSENRNRYSVKRAADEYKKIFEIL